MSAYADKVVRAYRTEHVLLGHGETRDMARAGQMKLTRPDFERFVADNRSWLYTDHFGLQTLHCGLDKHHIRDLYDVIALYDKGTIRFTAFSVMRTLGISRLYFGWGRNGSTSRQRMFDGSTEHATSRELRWGKLLSRRTCEALLQLFAPDYDRLPLPRPDCSVYKEGV